MSEVAKSFGVMEPGHVPHLSGAFLSAVQPPCGSPLPPPPLCPLVHVGEGVCVPQGLLLVFCNGWIVGYA